MLKIKIEDLNYIYKGSESPVLKGINAEFEQGKLYSIAGPSGSGKTTFLSILAGMDKPTNGIISYGEQDLSKIDMNLYRREMISMIFQQYHLFPLLTALENASFPMLNMGANKKDAKEKAKQLLESVGIDKTKQKRYPSNLSGGEQQRVAIARALSTGAKFILADEPTGNLDTANTDLIVSILKRLAAEENYCVIIVTHNMEIAETSDIVYRMQDGRLSQ